MAELTFCTGVMGVGKTESLIEQVEIYDHFGISNYKIFSTVNGFVESRNGSRRECEILECDLRNLIEVLDKNYKIINFNILIDEAQFLTSEQVKRLRACVYEYKRDIVCYGLITDYLGRFFGGSEELIKLADNIYKLDRKCELCNNKAILNVRKSSSEELLDLDKSKYMAVCQMCKELV